MIKLLKAGFFRLKKDSIYFQRNLQGGCDRASFIASPLSFLQKILKNIKH